MSGGNVPFVALEIQPVKVYYEPHGAFTDEAYFEPLFGVPFVDPIYEVEKAAEAMEEAKWKKLFK
jgi:hypothetical protein